MAPETRTLLVLTAAFASGRVTTETVDEAAGDRMTLAGKDGDVVIYLAPRPEARIMDPRRPDRSAVVVAAKPAREITWFKRHIEAFETHEAQAVVNPAYLPIPA